MKWLLRGAALVLLLVLAAGYLTIGCLVLLGNAFVWAMNATDRQIDKLAAWGDAL